MITLYDNPFSPFARKVRMALQWKGLAFESVDALALSELARLHPVNPRGDGEHTIWDAPKKVHGLLLAELALRTYIPTPKVVCDREVTLGDVDCQIDYRDAHFVDLRKARQMARTLEKIERAIEKTLTRLLGRPPSDSEVRKTKASLPDYQVTHGILSRLEEFLEDDEQAYRKYDRKYWQLIFLGQFLAPADDPRVRRLVEDVLSKPKWVSSAGGQSLTANILAAATRLGFGGHPVVRAQREALAQRISAEDVINCGVMDYSLLPRCQMAQPKVLLWLVQVEPGDRSKAVRSANDLLVRNLLANEVFVYVPGHRKQWQKVFERQPKPPMEGREHRSGHHPHREVQGGQA